MKHTLLLTIIAITSYASCTAQDFYHNLEHTPTNNARVDQYQAQQQHNLVTLMAYMAVLQDRYRHDAAFHWGRTAAAREHTIYNDNLAINMQQQAITRTRSLLADMDKWLKDY